MCVHWKNLVGIIQNYFSRPLSTVTLATTPGWNSALEFIIIWFGFVYSYAFVYLPCEGVTEELCCFRFKIMFLARGKVLNMLVHWVVCFLSAQSIWMLCRSLVQCLTLVDIGKPYKKRSGQTWDNVPSSLPPTLPYWSWEAYENKFQTGRYPQ